MDESQGVCLSPIQTDWESSSKAQEGSSNNNPDSSILDECSMVSRSHYDDSGHSKVDSGEEDGSASARSDNEGGSVSKLEISRLESVRSSSVDRASQIQQQRELPQLGSQPKDWMLLGNFGSLGL